jgi:hypothetical protein
LKKLFFNKGKRPDPFGKGRQTFFEKNVFFTQALFLRKMLPDKKSCHNSETSDLIMGFEKFGEF